MQRVTFGQFLERTTAYERMPVDINPGLRRGVWLGWLLTGILGILYRFLPSGSYLLEISFFRWTKGWLAGTWNFVADYRQVLVVTCSIVFFMTLVLLIATRAFHVAEIGLHIALFVPVIFAAVNIPFVVALLLPVLANLVFWVCITVACVLLGTLLLFIFSRALFH
jgi:hypothetical protein